MLFCPVGGGEKAMKKGLLLVLILVLTLSVGAFAFQNEPEGFSRLSFGGLIGRYTPSFGELKDYLDLSSSTPWEADLDFEGRGVRGLIVEYAIAHNFKFRGQWSAFNTQISIKNGRGWTAYKANYSLNVNAYTVSGIYTISPEKTLSYYIGAGLGRFVTEFEWDEVLWRRGSPAKWSRGGETEKPILFQMLAGFRLGTGPVTLQGEVYILPKVRMEDFRSVLKYDGQRIEGITIDLSGRWSVGMVVRL